MVQLGDRMRLAIEAIAELRVGSQRIRKDFDGDSAMEPHIASAIDLAQPARADWRDDFIGAKSGTVWEHTSSTGLSGESTWLSSVRVDVQHAQPNGLDNQHRVAVTIKAV